MGTVSSMTGYGNVKIQTELGELNIDVRSVNSRFLDFSFRCLEEFRPFEPKIRELVASTVARGKVEVRFNLTAPPRSALLISTNRRFLNFFPCRSRYLRWRLTRPNYP